VIALGVDPGTRRLGWGVVRREGSRLRDLGHGIIVLDAHQSLAVRLNRIAEQLGSVIERHHPDVGSVETLFFHKDPQAAAKLGHARGVVLFCMARAGVDVAEYAPARVKRTITGNGQADKRQVALVIKALLGLDQLPGADATDALALAVTHLRIGPLVSALAERPQNSALAALVASRPRRKLTAAAARRILGLGAR
jgi:crossover junction endodeoxyribonuclease RuvC